MGIGLGLYPFFRKVMPMKIDEIINEVLEEGLIKWVMSNPRHKSEGYKKSVITPTLINNQLHYQIESFTEKQAFHVNVIPNELQNQIRKIMNTAGYKQWQIFTKKQDHQILINKKGMLTVKKSAATKKPEALTHNKAKAYIFEEGTPIPFLIELGIMTPQGKVIASKYAKFRQINRYVELVEDVMEAFDPNQLIRIVDFGSGKSYLTFALYHYLVFTKKRKVEIIGLDLKADVIHACFALKEQLGYENLTFKVGDINDYEHEDAIDMVITLHACNTATDAALKKAVTWQAKVIMSVPCCHKEMNQQVKKEDFMGLFEYGIIRERASALFTDAIRGKWLAAMGYQVQLLEFIDMTHTPKNIMIRAIRNKAVDEEALKLVKDLSQALSVDLEILR